jgi:hypothetical protein
MTNDEQTREEIARLKASIAALEQKLAPPAVEYQGFSRPQPVANAWRDVCQITADEARACLELIHRRFPSMLPKTPIFDKRRIMTGEEVVLDALTDDFMAAVTVFEQNYKRLDALPENCPEVNFDEFVSLAKMIGANTTHLENMVIPAGICLNIPYKIRGEGVGWSRLAIVRQHLDRGSSFTSTYRELHRLREPEGTDLRRTLEAPRVLRLDRPSYLELEADAPNYSLEGINTKTWSAGETRVYGG